jgi:hypothetical protein
MFPDRVNEERPSPMKTVPAGEKNGQGVVIQRNNPRPMVVGDERL